VRGRPAGPLPPVAAAGDLPRGRRVGLLGGSFNPAHEGHRHIAETALKRLRLHRVWLLVSPQNPLKGTADMAPLAQRLASARHAAGETPYIVVTDVERYLDTQYTVDTVTALSRRFPYTRFVWLMGADALAEMHRWRDWERIFHTVPIAVFDRPSYSLRASGGKAATRFRRYRRPPREAGKLADMDPPAWTFFQSRRIPVSATALRARGAEPRGRP
jgi:nicotinate-nucleotide adenylyltransferase